MDAPKIGKVKTGDVSIRDIDMRSQGEREKEFLEVEDLTENAEAEIGVQLQKIREFEKKFKDEWKFDGDAGYYFTVCFRSKEERDKFLDTHNITLRHDNHVMIEDIRHKFREV